MKAKLFKLLLDAGAVAGVGIFVFGLYQVWHPLAPLLGGLILAAGCFFAAYDRHRQATFDRIRGGRS
jgi:hypothetical protein